MRILFLTRRFWPEVGGVEKHVLEVTKRLVKMGHEVAVVCEETFSDPSTAYRIPAGKNDWFKKWRIWAWLWKNRRLIQQADIVHAHDVGFWYWPLFLLYPKKRFFITFHGWEGKFPIPLKNRICRKISEKMAKGNICVGDYITKWYGTRADFVTYGGVSICGSRFNSFTSQDAIRQPPRCFSEVSLPLVFIGRLEEDTGLPVYLEAWKKARNKLRYYKLDFCGDGNLRKQAEKHGKVLGFVKNVQPYILKSRFVFASGYLSILEAMACKKLVFAVYDNRLKEDYLKMAPFADWIVIESDPKKLAKKIEYYLDHSKEEKKLVDKAYEWAEKQSWEKVVEMYLKLWGKRSSKLDHYKINEITKL